MSKRACLGETNLAVWRNPACSGVTLIEAVVSLALFALFLAGACGTLVATKQSCDRARLRYAAVNVAKNRIERVQAFDFDQLALCSVQNVLVNANGGNDANGDFRMSTDVMTLNTGLKQVTVRIEVRNRKTRRFDGEVQSLSTFVAKMQEPPSNE